ncbi:MAG: hypothetical protein EAX96_02755 [Candidatus Lokiarchaeota archaeon]|nr:hypothetical protein [Candidatus Lokiarchaeota archaeon]
MKNLGRGTNIEKIIDELREEENKLRLSQDKYLNLFDVIQKVMEIRTNLNILAQHFLGCLKVAVECEDALCAKIFIQQSFSTLNQMNSFYQAESAEVIDKETLDDLVISMNNTVEEAKKIISPKYVEKLEKIVDKLGQIIKEIPSARY